MIQIFEKIAKQEMAQFSLQSFKKSHPTLLNVILESMEAAKVINEMPLADVENKSNLCNCIYENDKGVLDFICPERRKTHLLEEIFYNKELSDAIRDIVVNSACGFDEALRLLNLSKNHDRDIGLIKKLKNCGIGEKWANIFISAINTK